jgi:CDGSH-type Zn-finger protein
MSERPTIECTPNGPYLVRQLEDLKTSRGEGLPVKPVVALCRCGGSANKPFCDGTHTRNGFSSARLSDGSASGPDDYRGRRITIHDNRAICAHAGRCTDGLAAVFKYGSEPWIDPDGASVEAVIDTIRGCPSGALSYSLDNAGASGPDRPPAITVTKDGPYAVVGTIPLAGASHAAGVQAEHYTLCRCGASKNKPFCDGSHWSAGFTDDRN